MYKNKEGVKMQIIIQLQFFLSIFNSYPCCVYDKTFIYDVP